jgi:hypothetical protein
MTTARLVGLLVGGDGPPWTSSKRRGLAEGELGTRRHGGIEQLRHQVRPRGALGQVPAVVQGAEVHQRTARAHPVDQHTRQAGARDRFRRRQARRTGSDHDHIPLTTHAGAPRHLVGQP